MLSLSTVVIDNRMFITEKMDSSVCLFGLDCSIRESLCDCSIDKHWVDNVIHENQTRLTH